MTALSKQRRKIIWLRANEIRMTKKTGDGLITGYCKQKTCWGECAEGNEIHCYESCWTVIDITWDGFRLCLRTIFGVLYISKSRHCNWWNWFEKSSASSIYFGGGECMILLDQILMVVVRIYRRSAISKITVLMGLPIDNFENEEWAVRISNGGTPKVVLTEIYNNGVLWRRPKQSLWDTCMWKQCRQVHIS